MGSCNAAKRIRWIRPLAHVLDRLVEIFEQRLGLSDLQAGKGYADIRRTRSDHADPIGVQQVKAYLFRFDALHRHAHEVAAVEGIDVPALRKARLVGDFVDLLGTSPERFELPWA